jgi:hypothetical protein
LEKNREEKEQRAAGFIPALRSAMNSNEAPE